MSAPSVLHFYSYATGVSIELPVGFERAGEDGSSASYGVLDDDSHAGIGDPQVRIQVVGSFEDDSDHAEEVRGLADGFAHTEGAVTAQVNRTIDERPTATVTVRRPDGLLLHLTAAASEHRLISVVASAAEESMLAAFDTAIESIRFIEL